MSKLINDKIKKSLVLGLVLISTTSLTVACSAEAKDVSETNVESQIEEVVDLEEASGLSEDIVVPTDGEKLSDESKELVNHMLKRIEVAINKNDITSFSSEFKLLMSDYTDSQIEDINTRLLTFVEDKHNFYFYDLLHENVDEDSNKLILVKMGYKNITDKDETNEYVLMYVDTDDNGEMKVYKLFFLDEEAYSPFVK